MKIYPSILVDTSEKLQSEIDRLAQLAPPPSVLQLDIIDGEFADELTIELSAARQVDWQRFQYDIHLMTIEPAQFLEEVWGDKRIRTVIGQIERMSDMNQFIHDVQEGGWQAGLSLDVFTPIEELETVDVQSVFAVQLMGNQAGRQGQTLHEGIFDKLNSLVALRSDMGASFEIIVDIGVNTETFSQLIGADAGAVGSALQGPDAQAHWDILNGRKG